MKLIIILRTMQENPDYGVETLYKTITLKENDDFKELKEWIDIGWYIVGGNLEVKND